MEKTLLINGIFRCLEHLIMLGTLAFPFSSPKGSEPLFKYRCSRIFTLKISRIMIAQLLEPMQIPV